MTLFDFLAQAGFWQWIGFLVAVYFVAVALAGVLKRIGHGK